LARNRREDEAPPARHSFASIPQHHPFWRDPLVGTLPPVQAPSNSTSTTIALEEQTMYDMYPEWGPAQHRPDGETQHRPVQTALDLRDNGGERPDDT
jgi:hypothetical protein